MRSTICIWSSCVKFVDGFLRGAGGGESIVRCAGGASDSDELRSDDDTEGEYDDPDDDAPDDASPTSDGDPKEDADTAGEE
jgi:hypothetical protein